LFSAEIVLAVARRQLAPVPADSPKLGIFQRPTCWAPDWRQSHRGGQIHSARVWRHSASSGSFKPHAHSTYCSASGPGRVGGALSKLAWDRNSL